jgi:Ca2+-transporting ATPase
MMSLKPFYAMSHDAVLKDLKTTPAGLRTDEVDRRLQIYGSNELKEQHCVTPFEIFVNQFREIFVIMLMIAASVALITGEVVDAVTIFAIIVLNTVIGFIQEYRSEKALEAMQQLTSPLARVLRGGQEVTISANEVVPGDILCIETGDRIPADARLLRDAELQMNEAVLTGESTPVTKTSTTLPLNTAIGDQRNMVFTATHAIYGRGTAVVTRTGMQTEFGKIAEMVQTIDREKTPLKRKLDRFAKRLGLLVIGMCVTIFVLEAYRGQPFITAFMLAIALAVSAVPEGLPAILTVTLALGARDLAKNKAVIRRLASVETLGSTTVICSDKTGTLTKGEMMVRQAWTSTKIYTFSGNGYEPNGTIQANDRPIDTHLESDLHLLLRIGALCNNAQLVKGQSWHILGDPTEGALLTAAAKMGLDLDKTMRDYPRIDEVPFSSERKRMATIHAIPSEEYILYLKGAPEVVLDTCTYLHEEGNVKRLTTDLKTEIICQAEAMAGRALRVLAIAYRLLSTRPDDVSEILEGELVFVGLMGMMDPPREEAQQANHLCQQAGIKTVMITGDHPLTATAIAQEIGMLTNGRIVTGTELDRMTNTQLADLVNEVSVFARVSPEHKIQIVRALKANGHIVAMTGDGVNDAPALKDADIGIAMGITGTDVTKEASDMVLADDNFATIVEAVRGGRVIYQKIRNFVRFLLSSNFDELLVISSFALLGLPLPLLPVMILWINLVTDGGPAVALSMDMPHEDVMQYHPRNPRAGILHGMMRFILVYVILQSGTTILTFWWKYYLSGSPLAVARTVTFMQACLFELVVVWNCRSEHHNALRIGLFSNRALVVAVLASALATISLCYLPVFQLMFDTVPLSLLDWMWIGASSLLGLGVVPEIFITKVEPQQYYNPEAG